MWHYITVMRSCSCNIRNVMIITFTVILFRTQKPSRIFLTWECVTLARTEVLVVMNVIFISLIEILELYWLVSNRDEREFDRHFDFERLNKCNREARTALKHFAIVMIANWTPKGAVYSPWKRSLLLGFCTNSRSSRSRNRITTDLLKILFSWRTNLK